jgi:hypothetical protein
MKPQVLMPAFALWLLLAGHIASAQQNSPSETPQQEINQLQQQVEKAQEQVESSQRQLLELKKSLAELQQRLANGNTPNSTSTPQIATTPAESQPTPVQNDDLRERQAMQESQIATLDQSKVETESKYPVKINGLIILNGFVNTGAVDIASSPTMAIAGAGSTGASMRQTILGVDARGPSVAGAVSHADLRVDFFGSSTQETYADTGGLLRLRTAHATLDWSHSEAFVDMDRPIISPFVPTSLVSVAEPALAWSGNLWSWSPQFGLSHTLDFGASSHLALTAAFIDVPNPPTITTSTTTSTVSETERSRWPGSELHVGLLGKQTDTGAAIGVGGYFSPHKTLGGANFNAWAGTLDFRLPLPVGFQLSGTSYRGLALGGLGGGAYKDYIYGSGSTLALDDVGGWAQLKKTAGSRLEFNAAFGIDNAFSSELRKFASTYTAGYQSLARNQTFFANTIYSPRAYLLFSMEYRHILSTPITGDAANSNIIGVAAAYKF